jgi:hypothetical protein
MSGILGALVGGYVAPVKITDTTANDLVVGGTASADYYLNSNGTAQRDVGGVLTSITGEWLKSGLSSQYDARGTWSGSAGTISGPTVYSNLATSRSWGLSVTNNFATRTLLIEIVRTGTTSPVLGSATITFEADGSP